MFQHNEINKDEKSNPLGFFPSAKLNLLYYAAVKFVKTSYFSPCCLEKNVLAAKKIKKDG
jgi:hypothetical protein